MGSKKESKQTTNQTQTVAPPSWTMPGITDAAGRVTQAMQGLPGAKYEGDFVAQPNQEWLTGALNAYKDAAERSGNMAGWVSGELMRDPSEAIAAATKPVFDQLMERALPGIRSSSLDAGAYSGDRAMQVLPTQAIAEYTDSANRQAQEYITNRMAMLPELIDTVMRMATGKGDILQGGMNLQNMAGQANIDNELMKNDYAWQYPFKGLDIASSLLAQLSGGYGTTTSNGTSNTTERTGGLGSVVGGLAGLAGMVGSLPMGGGASLGGNLIGSLFKRQAAGG